MAATKATAWGYDTQRTKETHRLGSQASRAQAATWRTFAEAYVEKDGSGYLVLRRDGEELLRHTFGPEQDRRFKDE